MITFRCKFQYSEWHSSTGPVAHLPPPNVVADLELKSECLMNTKSHPDDDDELNYESRIWWEATSSKDKKETKKNRKRGIVSRKEISQKFKEPFLSSFMKREKIMIISPLSNPQNEIAGWRRAKTSEREKGKTTAASEHRNRILPGENRLLLMLSMLRSLNFHYGFSDWMGIVLWMGNQRKIECVFPKKKINRCFPFEPNELPRNRFNGRQNKRSSWLLSRCFRLFCRVVDDRNDKTTKNFPKWKMKHTQITFHPSFYSIFLFTFVRLFRFTSGFRVVLCVRCRCFAPCDLAIRSESQDEIVLLSVKSFGKLLSFVLVAGSSSPFRHFTNSPIRHFVGNASRRASVCHNLTIALTLSHLELREK